MGENMADGYLNFNTKIDDTDFKAGIKSMGSSVQGLKGVLKSLSSSVKSAFDVDTSETSSKMMSLEEQLRKAEIELENATRKKEEFANTQIPTEEYAAVEKEAQKLEQKLLSLLDKRERFEDTGGNQNSRTYQQMGYDIDVVEKKLESAEAEMCRLNEEGKKFTMGSDTSQFDTFTKKADNAQGKVNILKQRIAELSAKESEAGSAGTSMSEKVSTATKSLGGKFASLVKKVGSVGSAISKNSGSISKNLNPVPKMVSNVGKKVDGLGKKLGGMVKKVFIFSMMTKALRALRSALQSVISADGDMANSLSQIKGNLLTAFAPLYSFILPSIKAVLSALVTFSNYLANVMSSIFGKTIEQSKALAQNLYKNSQATDKDTKSTKKNTKEKERQLSGLDQMHKWESNKDNDSDKDTNSGSSTAPSFNATAMDVPIVDKIKDLISADDWEGVGKLIATKLNKALKKIPWSKIQKTAADIATKLARLLNGFFSVMDLADTLGNTVAQALNTGLIFAYNFLTTFDFVQFGAFIGTSINSFIKNFQWDLLGKTLGEAVQGAIDTAYGFVTTYEWGSFASGIATTINNFFSTIDWSEAGETVGTAIIGIFTEISTFLAEVDWESIGTDIGTFLANIDWDSIISSLFDIVVEAVKAGWGILKGVVEGFISDGLTPAKTGFLTLGTVISGIKIAGLANKFSDFLDKLAPVKDGLKKLATEGFDAVKDGVSKMKGALSSAKDTLKKLATEGFDLAKDGASKMKDAFLTAKDTAKELVTKLWDLTEPLRESVKQIALNTAEWVKNNAQTALATIKTGLQTAATWLLNAAQSALNFVMNMNPIAKVAIVIAALVAAFVLLWNKCKAFRDFWKGLWSGIKDIASSAWKAIKEFFVSAWKKIKSIWSACKPYFSAIFKGIKKIFAPIVEFFKSTFKNALDAIKSVFSTVKDFFSGIVKGIKNIFSGFIDFITGVFTGDWKKAWNGVKKIFKGVWDVFYSIVKAPINLIIDGINFLWKGIYTAVKGIVDSIGSVAGALGDIFGKDWHFKMPKNPPTIPKLATGAVIPPNQEFLAVLGDQKRGTNIETPENLLRQIMREELGNIKTSGGGNYEFVAQINRRTLFDEVIKEGKLRKKTTGRNAFQF